MRSHEEVVLKYESCQSVAGGDELEVALALVLLATPICPQ